MSEPMVALIDQLKGEYGAHSRGRVLERLLQELIDPDDAASDPEVISLKNDAEPAATTSSDEVTSLVLISTGNHQQGIEQSPTSASGLPSGGPRASICRGSSASAPVNSRQPFARRSNGILLRTTLLSQWWIPLIYARPVLQLKSTGGPCMDNPGTNRD